MGRLQQDKELGGALTITLFDRPAGHSRRSVSKDSNLSNKKTFLKRADFFYIPPR